MIGVSVLLFMMAFRSIVVPLKAALMNMLAIGASIGFIVAIFQWGWGLSLIGLDRTGPIESFLPMFMFALLFGLSMDYEIFLLSRIREHWLETGDSGESVAFGIGASARVITAAAAILIAVFGSFAFFGDERAVKEFGMGMAFAIFIDATLVRLVLVPAFMQIAGPANWYMPQWLDNILPGLTIDPPIPVRTRVRRMIGIALHMVLARPQKSALR
ncbi:MAG: MMPL family transporter [Chloroflexi bacterium]|nr:MMPL family transporter [Chloroflexota bacterium]